MLSSELRCLASAAIRSLGPDERDFSDHWHLAIPLTPIKHETEYAAHTGRSERMSEHS
ncbi:hypothetical protein SNOG_10644 [Parastagonospora nodorum SN15]|nr:hypothetical protein SNOG_10644 [Parastagonospora nodorum SN15]EAT82038.2 hypothetical protein SNOG_10644 [Parastagonospora nodorum SN15]